MPGAKGEAMKVRTFMGKVSIDGLHLMDTAINDWMKRRDATPIHVRQSFGSDIHRDGRAREPIIVITVWYEEKEEL